MEVIRDKELYRKIWDRIYNDYSFFPSVDNSRKMWLHPGGEFKTFHLTTFWNEEQESIVNNILCKVVGAKMFALDWQHDCFLFDPNEKIPTGYMYYDKERDCNVYFPEYYPDGDYHFFVSKDWRFGLYGHPWRKELVVVGKELILEIEKNQKDLCLKKV